MQKDFLLKKQWAFIDKYRQLISRTRKVIISVFGITVNSRTSAGEASSRQR